MVPQHILTLFAIFFTRAILKGLSFGLCLYVLHLCNVQHVLYCVQLVRDLNLSKILRRPCVVDWAIKYKPSINKYIEFVAAKANSSCGKQEMKVLSECQRCPRQELVSSNRFTHKACSLSVRREVGDFDVSPLSGISGLSV